MIPSVLDVVSDKGLPWLLVGKGPTLDQRGRFNLGSYRTLTLNHACLVVPITLAHFADLSAFQDCAEHLLSLTRATVVLPWHPHVDMTPHPYTLERWADDIPALGQLRDAGRLVSYNSTLTPPAWWRSKLSTVRVRLFSAVAGLNILAMARVKRVYTLGIDGGTEYAKCVPAADRLANGQDSFDVQFKELRRTHRVLGVKLQPLVEYKS